MANTVDKSDSAGLLARSASLEMEAALTATPASPTSEAGSRSTASVSQRSMQAVTSSVSPENRSAQIVFTPKHGHHQLNHAAADQGASLSFLVEPSVAAADSPQSPRGHLRSVPISQLAQNDDESSDSPADPLDPENLDSELGEIRVRNTIEDPELGILRIREQPILAPTEQPRRPIAYLSGRVSYIDSDNIFLAINERLGIVGDDFLRYGVALNFYPSLGPQTFLLATAETNLQRYTSVTEASYDEIRFRVGVRQGLFPRTYGEIAWSYQELYRPSFRDRFFENHGFEFTLGRQDPLTDELLLFSYYRLQLNLSQPASFDRVIQALGTYAGYDITSDLEIGLNYQLTLADYTQQERYDTYHQLIGQLVYSIAPNTRMSLFGGFSFGRSSDPTVRFNDTIFGLLFESSLALF